MNRPGGILRCGPKHEQAHHDLEGPKLFLLKSQTLKEKQWLACLARTESRTSLFSTLDSSHFFFYFYTCVHSSILSEIFQFRSYRGVEKNM